MYTRVALWYDKTMATTKGTPIMSVFTPHVCSPTSCEIEGHDRVCLVVGCDAEIGDDATDACYDHRTLASDYDPRA